MAKQGKFTAEVWGGPLDGQVFTEYPPSFRWVRPAPEPDAPADAPFDVETQTYELVPWTDGKTLQYHWIQADLADRLRKLS